MNLQLKSFDDKPEEQPELHKVLWRRQLSQQSTYKAEIHELYTEMLNMRERSEMQSHCQHACASLNIPFQVEAWSLNPRMCLVLDLQVDAHHGFFPVKWRLQTGQHPQDYSRQLVLQCSLAQATDSRACPS